MGRYQGLQKRRGKKGWAQVRAGFSLIEVLISVTIFIVIMISTAQIFKLVVDGQRSALATQNVQESLKYFLEVIAKEIRTAKVSTGECGVDVGDTFKLDGANLVFLNYYGECTTYSLEADSASQRFKVARGSASGFISPQKIFINSLDFVLDQAGNNQPTVTILIDAWALNQGQSDSEIKIQTSIASRYYQ